MSIYGETKKAVEELYSTASLKKGDILVVGCSSSEVIGSKIGTNSSKETADEIFKAVYDALLDTGVYIAAQCCEHLNRAIILPRAAAEKYGYESVNVVPQPKAGGSFATAAYENLEDPVAVEEIKAQAGLDIGSTLIGMHIKRVAVPVRLEVKKIGDANVTAARSRAKFIGGERAHYNENLM
ncbi:MAG: TIGR01440 family protein [Clostridia bacterium]|nr:TIGR01440 family protein [Clostridia bacterium]